MCWFRYDTTFAQVAIIRKEVVYKIRFAQVKSTMTTFVKVQISFIVTTISTHCDDD